MVGVIVAMTMAWGWARVDGPSGGRRDTAQGSSSVHSPGPAPSAVVSTPLPGIQAVADSTQRNNAAPSPGSNEELLAYTSTESPHREGPYTYYPVDVSADSALASTLSGRLTLTAPDGSRIDLDYDRHVNHDDGNWTWIGRKHDGDIGQDAVITFGPDATVGTLPAANGQLLQITTVNGRTYLSTAAFSQLQRGLRAGGDTVVKAADGSLTAMTSQGTVTAAAASSASTTVDVLVAYSSGYRAYRGSASAATTALTNLMDVANRALSNTNITNVGFRLVGTMEVNYADNSDNGTALSDLASGSAFAAVRNARGQYGADLVSFVRRYVAGQNGCGLAYIPQQPYASSGPGQTWSVVGDGSYDLGSGAYSYCPDVSLAHEMGHNLGAQHNKQQNPTGGLYPYSYGYRNDSAGFFDVMAYGLAGQEQTLVYSSPDVSICKGLPCGVANDADVARTFRETMPIAAGFRATVVPTNDVQPGQLVLANGLGRCLDGQGGGTANGTPVQMWACNGLRQQQWGENASTAALLNKETPLALDAVGFGTGSGTPLQLFSASGAGNQAWLFTNTAVVANGNRVLDAVGFGTGNGTPIQLWDDGGSANQRWTFDPRNGRITNSAGRCLDVQNYGTANGTPVQVWDCSGTPNQTFVLSGGGTFVGYGGNCLEAANGGQANGTQVRMWACNGGANQKWRLRGEVRGVASNLCLDDPAGGTSNGNRVQLWQCLGNDHQRWEYQPN
ncbi:ricin-type beta-trefoil lectin domain protein [Bacillus sp. NP157]|nr:ricin-type beta-trefoil lectin domain protein [Bacillus sp. NP157]